MNKIMTTAFVLTFLIGITVSGCAQRTKNSQEAIEVAKTKATIEEQAKFLVQQAKQFINSKKFNEAIKTAKYVLNNTDANSAEAKQIIEKAQAELKKLAEQKIAEVKGKLGNIGK